MIKVSITIAAYNNAQYLPETLDSIFNQTYKNFEVIIVDDASTDNTTEVLKVYRDRIKYHRFDVNQGSASAWNEAIRQATGEYIALAAADDVWMPDKLELQMALFEQQPHLGLVYGRIISVDEAGQSLPKHLRQRRISLRLNWDKQYPIGPVFTELFMRSNFVPASTALIKKKAIEQTGWLDESLRLCQDYDFYLRIAHDFEFGFVDKVLVKYRRHPGSVSTGKRHRAFDYQRQVIDKMWRLFGSETLKVSDGKPITKILYRRRLAQQYAKEGRYYLRHGNKQLARESLARSLKYQPFRFGTLVKYLLTYL
ncbi:MAG: glycosyltransferase [Planctomycetota bacterium]